MEGTHRIEGSPEAPAPTMQIRLAAITDLDG